MLFFPGMDLQRQSRPASVLVLDSRNPQLMNLPERMDRWVDKNFFLGITSQKIQGMVGILSKAQ